MSGENSGNKAYLAPVALIAGLGVAGMGLISDSAVMADTTKVTDTINVTVESSCTFNSVSDKTYAGSAANGAEVENFNDSGVHEFNLFCNDHNGFIVTATPYDLESDEVKNVKIEYTDSYSASGTKGLWTAKIAATTAGLTVTTPAPVGGGTIIESDSNTKAAGATFTATYLAYVGSETPSGTYTGKIVYTLTPSGTSNSSTNHSGNNGGSDSGNSGSNSGSSNTDSGNTDSGNTDSGDSDSGNTGSSNSGNSSSDPNTTANTSSLNNLPTNITPLVSTVNTYSTNNYSTSYPTGGSAGTIVSSTTPASTASTNDDDDDTSSAASEYERPLGVTTKSTKSSTFDPAPIVVSGALLIAGVAAAAVAKNRKADETDE